MTVPRGEKVATGGEGRGLPESRGKTRDLIPAVAWFAVTLVARLPFVARIEGVLDHDQSVVGLMSLDIAKGRRFPIFFDGQRYMGAVEAYVAAFFVKAIGHAPEVVALAPWLAFGLFAAGQFVVWNRWRGRATGHLAAALTVMSSPMLLVWGLIPRGGYVEFLAWALPTLAVYREVTRPGRAPLSWKAQAGWGFLLAFGYFLNPLSLTVYATIALDWTFGRHGEDLRSERNLSARWLDSRFAPTVWLVAAVFWVTALAACCHVDPRGTPSGSPYVAFGGYWHNRSAIVLGTLGVVAILGAFAWWTNGPKRLHSRLVLHPWTIVGVAAAWTPFVLNGLLVRSGMIPPTPSLPVWIAAPWKSGPNLWTAFRAAGPLVGCDPRAIETVLIGQGIEPPVPSMPVVETALLGLNPLVLVVAFALIVLAVDQERRFLRRAVALRGDDVSPPIALSFLFLVVTVSLYLLQGTSPNASSIRYLVPVWVALPGLLACGLRSLRRGPAVLAFLVLTVPWSTAHWLVWQDMGRSMPTRPLASELVHRGVNAVVAPTPVALVVANLTHGVVGAVEYQPIWPRLGERYLGRFQPGAPATCVVDRRFPWAIRGEGAWAPEQDFGRHLLGLSRRHPGRVKLAYVVGSFEVWDVDLPLNEILAIEPDEHAVIELPPRNRRPERHPTPRYSPPSSRHVGNRDLRFD